MVATPTTPRKAAADPDDNIPCKTPSPRSSASQAPPNPRHNEEEGTPRVNPHANVSSHPFKGFGLKFMKKAGGGGHGDDLDDRLHRKTKEQMERAKKLDLGPALGPHDTVNVRERVRKWQAAGGGVVNGDPVEMPPIMPATPSPPAPRKRGLSTATAETDHSPLVPPDVIMKELREGWESASDADKQAERRRARSKERERKMKRRRDRERGLNKDSSVGAQTEYEVEVMFGSEKEGTSGVSKSIVYDDDGIRITPIRVKRRGSGSRKKKKKDKVAAAEVQTDNDGGGGVKVEPETEVEEDGGGVKVEVKAWEQDDGIRIYTTKPKTPIPKTPVFARVQGGTRQNSVRKGEKSVRARKEEFEAEMRRERKATKEFEGLVKQQEADEAEEKLKEERLERAKGYEEATSPKDGSNNNIEGSTIVGDTESAKKKWEEFNDDDGIRVKPLKKGRRKKGASSEKLKSEREASIPEESIAGSETEMEQEKLEEQRRRERELAEIESERLRQQRQKDREKLERERQRVRELEKLEQVRSRERENERLEMERELEIERAEKERLHQIELDKLEKERKRQRELEKALEKEKVKREKEKIRLREKEREMEAERKRERQRMKEREKELEREREREKEKMKEKERHREKERERERAQEREREKEMERERGLLRAKEKELEREREREIRRVRDMENQREMERQREREMEKEMQRRRNEKRRRRESERQRPAGSGSELDEDSASEPESAPFKSTKTTPRPRTPEDPLLEFLRKAAKRGSPRLAKDRSSLDDKSEQTSHRDSTPPLESPKRWESRKEKKSRSASATPTPSTPSPKPAEENSPPPTPGFANEDPPETPTIPNRPKRTKTKSKSSIHPPEADKPTGISSRSVSSQEDVSLKAKQPSVRSTSQSQLDEDSTLKDTTEERPSTARSDGSSRSSQSSILPVNTLPPMPLSPPAVKPLNLSPKKKKSDSGNLLPKVSSAASSFFKAVKEEFQAASARANEPSSSSSSSDSSSDGESITDVMERRTEAPTREKSVSRPKKEDTESESESESDTESEPEVEVKEKVKADEKKPEVKEEEPETPEEKPVSRSSSLKNSLKLQDIPSLPFPRRSIRNSTSPPRPKSHNRSRTEGSIKSTRSVSQDSASMVGSEHARTISLSSVATVKPLNITPRPTPVLKFDPVSPPPQPKPQKRHVEVQSISEKDAQEETYTPSILSKGGSLKRKFTKHEDLISILSAPKPGKSLRSAARSRSHRTKAKKANRKVSTLTVTDLMDEIAAEEVRYMRELRTLVEDVVPVLFATVLERADDVVRRRSLNRGRGHEYSPWNAFGANPTRPIVDMGISLERLKTMHEKMPKNPDDLLIWARDVKKVYEEYLTVWRMGFQDVVVTLVSHVEEEFNDEASQKQRDDAARKDLELLYSFGVAPLTPSPFEGDPSTWAMPPPPPPEPEEEEEKVDVAFLLKRPLVRLKILAKLFKRINMLCPSPLAVSLSSSFHSLVTMARRKIAEEKARIEDEAAASIDVDKACDIYSLLTKPDVYLDPSKRVRARDSFWMKLYHSSGRVIQRSVELILRDPAVKGRPHGGEILICEFGAGAEKWMLFTPIPLAAISARTGDAAGEIVVMVRGAVGTQDEWKQILVLQSATAAGFEWVQMLGLMPVPPEGPFGAEVHKPTVLETVIEESTIASASRMNTPAISQQGKPAIDVFAFMEPEGEEEDGKDDNDNEPKPEDDNAEDPEPRPLSVRPLSVRPLSVTPSTKSSIPRSENAFGVPTPEFKPAEAPPRPLSLPPDFAVTPITPGGYNFLGGFFQVVNVNADGTDREPDESHILLASPLKHSPSLHTLSDSARAAQNENRRSVSGSSIQRSRKASKPITPRRPSVVSLEEVHDERPRSPSPPPEPRAFDTPRTLNRMRSIHLDDEERPKALRITKSSSLENIPDLSPSPETPSEEIEESDAPPPVPAHKSKKSRTPVAAEPPVSSTRSGAPRRRTSSPLKHEYDPSSPSGSEAEVDEDEEIEEIGEAKIVVVDAVERVEPETGEPTTQEEGSSGTSSSSSEDEDSDDAVSICSEEEDGEYPPPMLSIPRRVSKQPSSLVQSPRQRPSSVSLDSTPTIATTATAATLQAPVPTLKFRASVFSWATSTWEKVHPTECRILITPGRIEGIPYSAPSPPGTPSSQGSLKDIKKPSDTSLESCMTIFNIELTPITPVRRGTAVDISIRTPKNSKFGGTSLMLRCRSPTECENLYNAINLNRIYPANFQPPSTLLSTLTVSESSETSTGDNTSVKRGWGSWGRSKTYRNGTSSVPGSVISGQSGQSGQSESSNSSVFGRFLQKNGMLKSSQLGSMASISSASSNGDGSRTVVLDGDQIFKIRLYRRENASKWRDLGNSRLSIMKPPSNHKRHNATGDEKRIIATNKKGNVVLLDVVLGESSFERVARTGIAVSVLVPEGEENGTGVPGDVGGLGAKSVVYMMQMKGEVEASYVFSIVGKLRY
ncbi:uncharacterized protein H6S33_005977 [Morchella sextelata]|uniref:uncharacterized protein n=1 Tax=Morchella sextelata TaxID=1174677 RepID=UPI001D03CF1E|nr:uncharacterized protein H6S33_005977 [Morchella sextelata]KAH0614091.1 hypothetical protein H6S33_005977 [Morchella sextelata]